MVLFSLFYVMNFVSLGSNISDFRYCSSYCIDQVISVGRSYKDENVDIGNCFFQRINLFNGDGGVIYASKSIYSMRISYTSFHDCSSSSNGGAICYNATSSELNKICAKNCSSKVSNHFAYLGSNQINNVCYLSMTACSKTAIGHSSINVINGNQSINNNNMSLNIMKYVSGIYFGDTPFTEARFCTVYKNSVSEHVCIYYINAHGIFSFSNIIQNNSPKALGVVRLYSGTLTMDQCIFSNNQNILFYVQTKITISNSFIYHSGTLTSGTVDLKTNISLSFCQSLIMNYYQTNGCDADFPLIIALSNPLTHRLQSFKMNIFLPISLFCN